MASAQELQELLGRALADEAFRARLMDDPEPAAREAGYSLTAEQLASLKALDLQTAAEGLDARLLKKTELDRNHR